MAIIGRKYIILGATVQSNCQSGVHSLIWRTIGQGPTGIAVGAGGDFLSFSLSPYFSHSGKTVRNLLKY